MGLLWTLAKALRFLGLSIVRAVMTWHSRCAKDSASCDTKFCLLCEHLVLADLLLKNFVAAVVFFYLICSRTRLPRLWAVLIRLHLLILIVLIATEKVSRFRSNIIWNWWKSSLRALIRPGEILESLARSLITMNEHAIANVCFDLSF